MKRCGEYICPPLLTKCDYSKSINDVEYRYGFKQARNFSFLIPSIALDNAIALPGASRFDSLNLPTQNKRKKNIIMRARDQDTSLKKNIFLTKKFPVAKLRYKARPVSYPI